MATTAPISRTSARWLASLQFWASGVLRCFGVREGQVTDIVFEVLARVKAEWSTFEGPARQFAGTARRRWIAELLLQRAAEVGWIAHHAPRGAVELSGAQASGPPVSVQQPVTGREMLRWLEQATTPQRWRFWIVREIDDVPVAEIARQQACSVARVREVIERVREDLQGAFSEEIASGPGTFLVRRRRARSA